MSSRNWYCLENKMYPYTSLENEMKRLFCNLDWGEDDVKPKEEVGNSLLAAAESLPSTSSEVTFSNPQPSTSTSEATGNSFTNPPPSTQSSGRKGFPESYRTQLKLRAKKKVCKFCLKNQEPPEIVYGHTLKDKNGNVTCPILWAYKCDLCGGTGDKAHTKKYCPLYEKIDFNSVLSNRLYNSK